MGGHGQPVDGSFGRDARSHKRHSRRFPRRQRRFPLSAQFVGEGQPPAGAGPRIAVAAALMPIGELAQQHDGVGVLRAHLSAPGQPVDDHQPGGVLLARWPMVERCAQRAGGVPVGVHSVMLVGRREQRPPGLPEVPGGQVVHGDQRGYRIAAGQRAGQRPVQAAAAGPRDVGISRLLGQRVAKRDPAIAGLGQQPGCGEPVGPRCCASGRHDHVDVELDACHGGSLQQRPFLRGQPRRPQQDRLPDALGYQGSAHTGERDRAVAVGQTAGVAEREGQFFDGEREPVGPPGHRRGQRRLRRCPPQAGQHVRHVVIAERAELDLGELVVPAEQRPDGAQAMTAWQLIAAVTANDGDWEAACGIGQRHQQVQACLIRPLQVIQEQRQGAIASRGGQH